MNESKQLFGLIKAKIGTIIMGGVLIAALSFLFLVISQKSFKVNSDFLIVPAQSGGQDIYTLSKSSDYLSRVFGEAVYSELFINEVINTKKVNSEFLPFNKSARLKEWSNRIKVNRNTQVGMIGVEIFADKQKEGLDIMGGVSEVLTAKSNLFLGSGQNIEVKLLSGPIVEKNPSFGIIILSIFGGFVLGGLITLVGLYYFGGQIKQEKLASVLPDSKEYKESLDHLGE
jgi:hypothetical protein